MSEVLWAKLYCKMCDQFCLFLLALRLSARKIEIKKRYVHSDQYGTSDLILIIYHHIVIVMCISYGIEDKKCNFHD